MPRCRRQPRPQPWTESPGCRKPRYKPSSGWYGSGTRWRT
ncbi:hypothetical protein EVA_12871 [gut metagenome]|uniref:Uncharacterized protein n=1 Tax=gut metagenome TaxID=749906 RepID=J9GB64_9ZZZZ